MLVGAKKGRSDATTARWSRSSTCARYSAVAAIGNATSTVPLVEHAGHAEAGSLEDVQHRLVLRHHLGHEALDANLCRARSELLQEPRADASPLMGVGDGESGFARSLDLATVRSSPGQRSSRPRPNRACRSTRLSRASQGREMAGRAPGEASWRRGSGSRGSGRRDRERNSTRASASAARGGLSRSVPPSRRMTSTTGEGEGRELAPPA